ISGHFVREVESLIRPGTSALFVLDVAGDMDAILHAIRGLGGTVLKTNVDLERAKLIQSTLAASAATTQPNGQSESVPEAGSDSCRVGATHQRNALAALMIGGLHPPYEKSSSTPFGTDSKSRALWPSGKPS